MRQRMQRNLHSRTGHGFEERKMCNVRIPRSEIALVESRFKKGFETNQVQCNHAHDNSNHKDLINYRHAACFSPVKSAWITAIKNGYFTSWPGLTEHAVEKNLSKSTSTTKGHFNQQRQHSVSTKVKDPKVIMTEPDLDQGIKTQYVYAATIDAGQIYTDQTGRFPVVPSKGNKYIMILYDYDRNAILAQPIEDRTAPELLRAFQVMEQELVAGGLKPKLMKLTVRRQNYSKYTSISRISHFNWSLHISIDEMQLKGRSDHLKIT
jgi:hypothetical protein